MFNWLIERMMKKRNFIKYIDKAISVLHAEDISYSQNFEDIIVYKLLEKEKGLYVDVGAHHPTRFSNTYKLYLKGWNGINIDPLPGCKELFDEYRPDDVNLNLGISSSSTSLKYYDFEEPAYNTLSEERAKFCIDSKRSTLKGTYNIDVVGLKTVFEKYLERKTIDFMNLDVETYELEVLGSNDWDLYRPRLIAMESIVSSGVDINDLKNDVAISYLIERNYRVVAKVNNAVFLMDSTNEE